jgi:hypothetical protein
VVWEDVLKEVGGKDAPFPLARNSPCLSWVGRWGRGLARSSGGSVEQPQDQMVVGRSGSEPNGGELQWRGDFVT